MTLGTAIKIIRVKRGFTQYGLSEKSGYSKQHIAAIEQGRYNPNAATLTAVAKTLRVPVFLIFFMVEEGLVTDITLNEHRAAAARLRSALVDLRIFDAIAQAKVKAERIMSEALEIA